MKGKKSDRQMDRALKRFARSRLDRALLSLVRAGYRPAEGVHDCRKSLKQVRTLLRIIRPQMNDLAREAGDVCKDTGAALARARDAHVMQQNWAAICQFRPVNEPLAQKVAVALSVLDAGEKEPPPLFPLAVDLIRVRDAVLENWRLETADRLYRKRLDRFHAQTRNQWIAAEETSQPEHYHSARKAAKNWMYALRVVRSDWGSSTKRLHRDLKAFTEALGNANDCAVLEQWLGRQDGLGEAERMAALEAVLGYRGHWLAQARSVCPVADDR